MMQMMQTQTVMKTVRWTLTKNSNIWKLYITGVFKIDNYKLFIVQLDNQKIQVHLNIHIQYQTFILSVLPLCYFT